MKVILLMVFCCIILVSTGCEAETYATYDNSPDSYVSLANSIFKQIDKNGDGFLSKKELAQMDNNKFQRDFQRQHSEFTKRHNDSIDRMNKSIQPPLITPRQFMGL